MAINTHNRTVDFGRHKGEMYTRLPVSYLNWMVNSNHSRKEIAEAELARRGTTMPELELSGHAIDRASNGELLQMWQNVNRETREGFHSWLLKMAQAAWGAPDESKKDGDNRYWYGFKWCFEGGEKWPVLKTVMKDKKLLTVPEDAREERRMT